MAIKATIFKVELNIADMDRGYYGDHVLTIARHPSETDSRMMARVLAFAIHASDSLTFGKGMSSDDEPDLWRKDLTGAIELWIDLGQPDERRIRRACGRSQQVYVYTYSGRAADVWWGQVQSSLSQLENLSVVKLTPTVVDQLATLVTRSMRLQCTIQDGQAWFSDGQQSVEVQWDQVQGAPG